jgi:homeodomain-containing protein
LIELASDTLYLNSLETLMPNQTSPKIELSERVRKLLEDIARQRRSEHRQIIRARLLLSMADGVGNNQLARQLKMDRGVVRSWRNRWLELTQKLRTAQDDDTSDSQLRELLLGGLSDLPRSGTPPTFTAEQICQIIAIACQEPSDSRRPISHWTPPELADEVVKRQIVESISASSVRRFLKAGRLKAASY